ncbi:hypothetical protein I79_010502 [Cricetulus griseus]|uniref:Uncharacterized protein n=1 Tax=Cricetulus griseus TaxID=10029 RepID=G3HIM8_CRIGR|nr:hypothetical protein I79_010502 [Cricetulus griseus]
MWTPAPPGFSCLPVPFILARAPVPLLRPKETCVSLPLDTEIKEEPGFASAKVVWR